MAMEIRALGNEIVVGKNALREMKKLKEFQITIQEMKNEEEEIRTALEKAMDEAGVVKFENDFISVKRVAPSVQQRVDTTVLKEKHPRIYKECTKETKRKGFVKIEYKE